MDKDLLKKGVLVGVGLASFAQEKAKQLAKELAREGYLNEKEGRRLVKNICTEAEHSGRRVASVVQKEMKKLLKSGKGRKK